MYLKIKTSTNLYSINNNFYMNRILKKLIYFISIKHIILLNKFKFGLKKTKSILFTIQLCYYDNKIILKTDIIK